MHKLSDHMAKILERLAEMFPHSDYQTKLESLKDSHQTSEFEYKGVIQ